MAGYMQTSSNIEWETPQYLFNELNKVFHFNMDCACTQQNKKCKIGSTKEKPLKWKGNCWINPPYGNIQYWVEKACYYHEKYGSTIVLLIPSSTELKAWKDFIYQYAKYLIFIFRRINFEFNGIRMKKNSTKGSALIVFSKKEIKNIKNLKDIGFIIDLEEMRKLNC